MGARQLSEPVVDAGPLIHLAEIGALDVLSVFDALHVPDAVWDEAVRHHGVEAAPLRKVCRVVRHSVDAESTRFAEQAQLKDLHRGEIECLYVCREQQLELLLTDDLAVRHRARELGLTPVGSLGVVVRAFRRGRIDYGLAKTRIESLYSTSSLFVTRSIVELAIERLAADDLGHR